MKSLLQRLGERGWQITPQRRAVAQVLAGEHVHLCADEIHERAVAIVPEVSRATVYNTLAELVLLGELREVSVGRAKRYDPNPDTSHQHLVCERCGTIRDVHPEADAMPRLARRERHGFAVTGVDVVFHGVCAACGTTSAAPDRVPRRRGDASRCTPEHRAGRQGTAATAAPHRTQPRSPRGGAPAS